MATRRTSPRRPTAMEPMAMAAGPSANLSTRPSAAKLGPHASTFSCCAMNNPAASRVANENDLIRKLSVPVSPVYAWLGKNTFHFLLVTLLRHAHMRQTEFMPFVCSVPVYLGDYYIPFFFLTGVIIFLVEIRWRLSNRIYVLLAGVLDTRIHRNEWE